MKTAKWILVLTTFTFSVFLNGCKKDNNGPTNEAEVLTTLRLTFTPVGAGPVAVLQFRDIDGSGGNAPVVTADTLSANTNYNVAIEVLNESVSPVDTTTNEIREENVDHQFFFQPVSGLHITFAYTDTDDNGHPVGLSSTAVTGTASSGNLTVTLRHQPDKTAAGVPQGDITNAGGESDIEVTFEVVIQ